MGEDTRGPICRRVQDELSAVVDATAPRELIDHIASCDVCRDARHDAVRAAEMVAATGKGYAHPDNFEDTLIGRCETRPEPKTAPKPAAPTPATPKPEATKPAVPEARTEVATPPAMQVKKQWLWVLAAAVVLVVAVALLRRGRTPEIVGGEPWSARVESVWRASSERSAGLEARSASGSWGRIGQSDALLAGSRMRTDGRTRARLLLSDGSRLMIDRDTEIELVISRSRTARLLRGSIVADVVRAEGAPDARFILPHGHVDVVGTKLALQASDDRVEVEVSRGAVRLVDSHERSITVRAGEQGRIIGDGTATLAPASDLAQSMEWSDQEKSDPGDTETVIRGLGELRAKKPGETKERDRAVHLAKHSVKVRVVDNVARTEIDETFANDSGDTLEGIFRFPLPADAEIERLALEVDGTMQEGAFVERDKAAAIWRGVIQHAAPLAPKPKEEIIWVPGPWRDPALLEWQAGGRFELRVFPIPARGARRIVLAYTQTVPPSGGVRRYTYPLAYDPSGSTSVDQFDVDVQVLGHDPAFGIRPRGYDLRPEGKERLTFTASHFVPAGDLSIEYALADRDAEITAWAFRPDGADAPYVALALRPKLPRWNDERVLDHVIVVDASRSMVGERYARASRLAAAIVREMDTKDRFRVIACDSTCQAMSREFDEPGPAASERVAGFLGGIVPEGGTDLVEAIKAARGAGSSRGRSLRVTYIGDGSPSVGPVLPDHVTAEVARLMPTGDSIVTAVAIGSDADTASLAALARGGGGTVVPYVPGQRVSSAAVSVLAAAYGITLRDPSISLPAGLTDMAPVKLDPIAAGSETIIVARMAPGTREIAGELKLFGSVGSERYEQRFPIRVVASSGTGNAFVPRLYASRKIADLERLGDAAAKADIVSLSKRFAVASRYTSLLVLESPAMFNAYGLDRSQTAPAWTGEQEADSTTAASEQAKAEAAADEAPLGQPGQQAAAPAKAGAGMASGAMAAAPAPVAAAKRAASMDSEAMADSRREKPSAPLIARDDDRPPDILPSIVAPPRPRTRMIPMKRVWDRKGQVGTDPRSVHAQDLRAIDAAERAATQNPDNRAKTADLYRAYAVAGRLERASDVAERWSQRDPLDPDALLARADVAARMGDRDHAIRILGSIVDVRPADPVAQSRLADLETSRGARDRACAHRIALASLRPSDTSAMAAAVRCGREQGMTSIAERLMATLSMRAAVERELAKAPPAAQLRGDVRIDATWDPGPDLDVALVGPAGQRFSWLGASKIGAVSAADATGKQGESLGIANLAAGTYVVEITRADGRKDPVRGSITARAVGQTRTIPFQLVGDRAEAGTVRVYYEARLVPL